MIFNGELPAVQGVIYTVPDSIKTQVVNLFRIVNNSAGARTFTIYIKNSSGVAQPITPISTQLPIGAAYDDFVTFQLRNGGTVEGVADAAGVAFTLNVT